MISTVNILTTSLSRGASNIVNLVALGLLLKKKSLCNSFSQSIIANVNYILLPLFTHKPVSWFFCSFAMGIEFREGSLVLNAKNQYKLKKGKNGLTELNSTRFCWACLMCLCVCLGKAWCWVSAWVLLIWSTRRPRRRSRRSMPCSSVTQYR